MNWKEHSEAITLNRKHGAFSVEMLKKWKVALTIKQEEMLKDNKNKSNKKAKLYFLREVLLSFYDKKDSFFRFIQSTDTSIAARQALVWSKLFSITKS